MTLTSVGSADPDVSTPAWITEVPQSLESGNKMSLCPPQAPVRENCWRGPGGEPCQPAQGLSLESSCSDRTSCPAASGLTLTPTPRRGRRGCGGGDAPGLGSPTSFLSPPVESRDPSPNDRLAGAAAGLAAGTSTANSEGLGQCGRATSCVGRRAGALGLAVPSAGKAWPVL